MPGNAHDLLTEPWISTIDADDQAARLTLPDVLHALGSDHELGFSALQGHQRQAWYAFVVQLGALALARVGGTVSQDAAAWRAALLELADGQASAWHLVAADLAQPAFFQPPVPEGHLKAFKRFHATPALLDVRIAAKNFDVKADLYGPRPQIEHWAFALLTLQTMEGFLGRGNYGVARMNGGFSSRPEAALTQGTGWSARLRRDIAVLLDQRKTWLDIFHYNDRGTALIWLQPWQGKDSLELSALDPFFLEVCRRVRLTADDGNVIAWVAPSDAARVHGKPFFGHLGDPWTPVLEKGKDGPNALTVSERGFHYRLVHELLLGKAYLKPAAMELRQDERGAVWASFRAMARGQGKTGGYHERRVLIPGRIAKAFGRTQGPDTRRALAKLSDGRIEQVGELSKKLLKPALLRLTQERVGTDGADLNWKDSRPQPWLDAFDRAVDDAFFERLFDDFAAIRLGDDAREAAIRGWHQHLYGLMRRQLHDAIEVLAPSGVHRYRAIARATTFFEGSARKKLDLAPPEDPIDATPSAGLPATPNAQEASA